MDVYLMVRASIFLPLCRPMRRMKTSSELLLRPAGGSAPSGRRRAEAKASISKDLQESNVDIFPQALCDTLNAAECSFDDCPGGYTIYAYSIKILLSKRAFSDTFLPSRCKLILCSQPQAHSRTFSMYCLSL